MKSQRGFTLIELMVALSGGLFFTIFVFLLTRDASRFFQRETRLADTTLSAITGFQRLRADVARAGFLASPNLAKDIYRCPRGGPAELRASAQWSSAAPILQQMSLLQLTPGAAAPTGGTGSPLVAPTPDSITLYGNYTSDEQFPVRAIQGGGSNVKIYLEPNSGALARLGYLSTAETQRIALLERVFPAGRALRIVNPEGEEQYAIIGTVTIEGGAPLPVPVITLSAQHPQMIQRSGSATGCGIRGNASGVQVNTVNIIRYELRNLNNAAEFPQFAYLYQGARSQEEEENPLERKELVRYEVLPTAAAEETAFEVVAEYAVDLKFGLLVEDPTVVTARTLRFLPAGTDSSTLNRYASNPFESPANQPNSGAHLIRGVHVNLAVRSMEADREANIDTTNLTDVAPGLYRVPIGTNPQRFARVRSLQAMVMTRNTRNQIW